MFIAPDHLGVQGGKTLQIILFDSDKTYAFCERLNVIKNDLHHKVGMTYSK